MSMATTNGEQQATGLFTLQVEPAEIGLLLACVGFQAKALGDPGLRDRLYRLWCRLETAANGAGAEQT